MTLHLPRGTDAARRVRGGAVQYQCRVVHGMEVRLGGRETARLYRAAWRWQARTNSILIRTEACGPDFRDNPMPMSST